MKLEEEDLMPDIMPSDAINTLETFSFYREKVFSQGPLKILEHQANSLPFNSETYATYSDPDILFSQNQILQDKCEIF